MRPLFFLIASFILVADNAVAQVSFAPEIGINMCTYMKLSGTKMWNRINNGIRAGGKADITLTPHFHLQPGVLYAGNGYNPPIMAGGANKSMKISTIEVPFQLVYKINTAIANTPFIGVGPYLGCNISGRANFSGAITYPYAEPGYARPLKIGSAVGDDIKQFDAGVSASAGLQLANGLYVLVLYQRGLMNLLPQGDAGNSLKSFNIGFSAGYYLHSKHKVKTGEVMK